MTNSCVMYLEILKPASLQIEYFLLHILFQKRRPKLLSSGFYPFLILFPSWRISMITVVTTREIQLQQNPELLLHFSSQEKILFLTLYSFICINYLVNTCTIKGVYMNKLILWNSNNSVELSLCTEEKKHNFFFFPINIYRG